MFMVDCQRCGVEYDFDADRRMNPHGHGLEPRPHDHPEGATRVRILKAASYRDARLEVGQEGTIRWYSPPHHSSNGGGYTLTLDMDDGRQVDAWSRWTEVIG